jgi:hypothetical protein
MKHLNNIFRASSLDPSTFRDVAEAFERTRRLRAERAEYYEQVRSTIGHIVVPTDPTALAKAIIAAGNKRRNEGPVEPPRFSNTDAGRLARKIVKAGRKVRGEQ